VRANAEKTGFPIVAELIQQIHNASKLWHRYTGRGR
jgi:hypothetical protein